MRFEHGDHLIFAFFGTDDYVDRMVQTIEKGTADRKYSSYAPLGFVNFVVSIFEKLVVFYRESSF